MKSLAGATLDHPSCNSCSALLVGHVGLMASMGTRRHEDSGDHDSRS
jgi:hypothetical protein